MIQGLPNAQPLHKRPEAKSIEALRQQAPQRPLPQRGQENQELSPTEQVSLSKELSDDLNGVYQQDSHQGLEAMMANLLAPQQPKQVEANDKVKEVGKSAEVGKVEDPAKKPQVRELKEDEKLKDPKAADRMGNLKVSSKKESQGVKDKPQPLPRSEQSSSHHKMGSKGAPKTDAPRPVGQTEQMKSAKPDGRIGLRQLPLMGRGGPSDGVDLSQETQQQLGRQKQPAYA